jgi:hypothetical protein
MNGREPAFSVLIKKSKFGSDKDRYGRRYYKNIV